VPDRDTDRDSVQNDLFEAIEKKLRGNCTSNDVLRLAEAWAWLVSPDQPHGSPGTAR
jgi:hypothetical protein